jgi:hypothetical protein
VPAGIHGFGNARHGEFRLVEKLRLLGSGRTAKQGRSFPRFKRQINPLRLSLPQYKRAEIRGSISGHLRAQGIGSVAKR